MKFKDIQPSVIELPPGQQLFRVQRTRALLHSVRLNGITLPPTGLQTGRFCLPDVAATETILPAWRTLR